MRIRENVISTAFPCGSGAARIRTNRRPLFAGIDGEVDVPVDVPDGDAGESLQAEAASATAPDKTTAHKCLIKMTLRAEHEQCQCHSPRRCKPLRAQRLPRPAQDGTPAFALKLEASLKEVITGRALAKRQTDVSSAASPLPPPARTRPPS